MRVTSFSCSAVNTYIQTGPYLSKQGNHMQSILLS